MKLFNSGLLLLIICMICSCTNGQSKIYEGKYYKIALPNSDWTISEEEYKFGEMNLVFFTKKDGNIETNLISIVRLGMVADPYDFIAGEIGEPSFLESANINDIVDSDFKGIQAKKLVCESIVNRATYITTCYSFVKGDATYLIMTSSKIGYEIDYSQKIWTTFEFKGDETDTNLDTLDLDDEINRYVHHMNNLPDGKGVRTKLDDGFYAIGIAFDSSDKCLIHDYEFTGDYLEMYEDHGAQFILDLKPDMIEMLNETKKIDALTRKCMEAKYNFRYRYFCNDKMVCDMRITAEEYN